MTLEEEIALFLEQTGGTVIFRKGQTDLIISLSTPSSASVRRMPINTVSRETRHLLEAFLSTKHRHTIKCAAATCVACEVDGKQS